MRILNLPALAVVAAALVAGFDGSRKSRPQTSKRPGRVAVKSTAPKRK